MSRTISTTLTNGITLVSGDSPVSITATGSITEGTNDAVYGASGVSPSWTVTNAGTIVDSGASGIAVHLKSSGTYDAFTNESGGLITSTHNGVAINDAGVVTNMANATITSSDTGLASAVYTEGLGTVVNAGLLQASNIAVYELVGGSVTNSATGTIAGAGGVYLHGPATVTNAGTIIGTNAAYGAVLFDSNAASSRLIVDPGAVFTGRIISLANSTNVIELASSSSAGTLAGFDGGSITNFATLQFDSGAAWTVTGTSAASGLGSIAITGFAAGDTIDLTGFNAVSETFASDALVLTDGSDAHATLHIQGSFTSGSFSLASDGSTGTDIFLGTTATPALVYGQTIDETGIIAASETVAAGILTLFDGGGTAVGPIAVGTSLSTGDFSLTSDGSGGTDVIVSTIFGTYTSGVTLLTNPTSITATGNISDGSGVALVGPAGTNWTLTNSGTVTETAGNGVSFASAGTVTNTGSGLITSTGSGIVLAGGGNVTNQSGGTIAGHDGVDFGTAAPGGLYNAGVIIGDAPGGAGVAINGGGSITNAATGTISGYKAISGSNTAATVVNAGSLSSSYFGVYLTKGGSVTNQTGGVINADQAVVVENGEGIVVNYGIIQGGTDASGSGIALANGGTITNHAGGTIAGRSAIGGPAGLSVENAGDISGTFFGVSQSGGTISNLAGGVISGGIDAVKFAAGYASQLIIAPGATFTGSVDGGNPLTASTVSTLELASASGAGTLSGLGSHYINFAQVTIDAAATWTISAGAYGFSTLTNAGTLSNGLSLGIGPFTVSNQSTGTIAGGVTVAGTATVANQGSIAGGVDSGVSILSSGVVTNASGGVISGYRGVSLGSGTVTNAGSINVTGEGVYLASGGSVTNATGGTITAGTGIASQNGSATIVNYGVLNSTGTGVFLWDGGAVTNQSGGTIAAANGIYIRNASGSLVNAGSIGATGNYGALLLSGGAVTNQSTGRITGPVGVELLNVPATVFNAGYIGGTSTGVWVRSGGTVVNQSGGTIAGTSDAVSFASGFTNRLELDPGATFIGTVDGGNVVGGTAASTLELGSAASAGTLSGLGSQFINFAQVTIDAAAQWTLTGDNTLVAGATLGNAGTLTTSGTLANAGTITGGVLGLDGGVLTNQASGLISGSYVYGTGSVTNFGSIGVSAGTAVYASDVTNAAGAQITGDTGVRVGLDGTVTNAGTIASNLGDAGTAVTFQGGVARLIDDPGAVFTGSIYGGAGGTATFELASGSSAGVVTGFGSSITNFGTLVFDAGSQWTVAGAFASGPVVQGFGLGDTIDVTDFAATGRVYDGVSHALILSDGLGDFETLDIQGTFSTSDFHIQSTGSTTEVAMQQVPTIAAGGTATFMGGGSPIVLDSGLTVADEGSAVLVGATIAINSGFALGDVLGFSNTASITGSYDASTGVLTLSGTDTLADYQAALGSITYSFNPGGADPTGGAAGTSRGIGWSIDDGVNVSGQVTSTLAVEHTPPTITAGASIAFAGGDDPVALDGSLTVTDADSGDMLTGATVVITSGFLSGDVLNFTNTGSISGSYDSSTGTLVLSGSADVAAYQAALDSVTYSYSPTDSDPTASGADTARTLTWTVDDGVNTGSAGSTLTVSHAAPTVTVGGTVAFATGGSVAATLAPDLTVSDPDSSGVLTGATVVIGGFVLGDMLNFTNAGSITGSFDSGTGTLVLSGGASLADYQAALESITFSSSVTTAGSRAIGWTVDDGLASSASGTSTVEVTRDAPTITGAAAGQATTDEMAISPFSGVAIGDPNSGQTETVTITLSDASAGTLSNLGGGVFNDGTYVVSGATADVTQAVDGLVFTPVPHSVAPGGTVTTTFTLQVTDSNGVMASDDTTSVVATAVNDTPTITQISASTGVPNTGTVSVGTTPFSGITVTDPDIGHVDTVTVTMGSPGDGAFSNLSDGTYDAETGVYTFVGTPSDATAALAALVFTGTPPGAGTYVATANFAIEVTGPGGSASDNTISVSTVAQNPPGLGSAAGSSTISVSSDGSSFAAPTDGQTNEAIVSGPTNGGTYTLPTDYQAIYLGGTADATLSDNSVGNAVLIGNGGNDTIVAGADNDTLSGGGGANTFIANGSNDVISASGTATVQTSGTDDVVYGNENLLTVTDSGNGNAIGLGIGDANLTLTGTNASVFANSGSVVLTDSGSGTAIGAYSGSITATLSGTDTALYGGTGDMSVIVSDTASNVAIAQGTGDATIVVGGDNTTVFGSVGALDVTIQSTATNAAIGTGSGNGTVTVAGDNATLFGGSGSLVATVSGRNDAIGLSDGAASITLTGTDAVIYGGSGAISVLDQGVGDTIDVGTGNATVTADGQDGEVIGSGGTLQVTAGTGSDTIFGGSGVTTITGGSGGLLMFGDVGGAITFIGGTGSGVYQAQGGAETFDGSAATANLILNGGIEPSGQDTLIGGSGNDTLCAGEGSDTMTGGGGQNQFVFYRSVVAGAAPADVITDFNGNDTVYLAGYGSSEAANALAHATSSGGSTTLTLSDNTRIMFQNVASVSALTGHLLSF